MVDLSTSTPFHNTFIDLHKQVMSRTKATKTRTTRNIRRTATTTTLNEDQRASRNARKRSRRRGLDSLMREIESLSITSTAECAVTPPHQQPAPTASQAPRNQLRKGDRLTSNPANNYFQVVSPCGTSLSLIHFLFLTIQTPKIPPYPGLFFSVFGPYIDKPLLSNTFRLRRTSIEDLIWST